MLEISDGELIGELRIPVSSQFGKLYAMFINKKFDKFYEFQAKRILHIAQNENIELSSMNSGAFSAANIEIHFPVLLSACRPVGCGVSLSLIH